MACETMSCVEQMSLGMSCAALTCEMQYVAPLLFDMRSMSADIMAEVLQIIHNNLDCEV